MKTCQHTEVGLLLMRTGIQSQTIARFRHVC